MHRKSTRLKEEARFKKAFKHSDDSRSSVTGYLETGNDKEVHAKARAMRNNDNGSHI